MAVIKAEHNNAAFIQGRASVDIIKSGGYKISALEIEAAMLQQINARTDRANPAPTGKGKATDGVLTRTS